MKKVQYRTNDGVWREGHDVTNAEWLGRNIVVGMVRPGDVQWTGRTWRRVKTISHNAETGTTTCTWAYGMGANPLIIDARTKKHL